jgi:hypothetical protein
MDQKTGDRPQLQEVNRLHQVILVGMQREGSDMDPGQDNMSGGSLIDRFGAREGNGVGVELVRYVELQHWEYQQEDVGWCQVRRLGECGESVQVGRRTL